MRLEQVGLAPCAVLMLLVFGRAKRGDERLQYLVPCWWKGMLVADNAKAKRNVRETVRIALSSNSRSHEKTERCNSKGALKGRGQSTVTSDF